MLGVDYMKGLRNQFERFCYRNRNWGVPNLMLYITLGSALVYLMSMFGFPQLTELLMFDRALILRGQIWRLFTYVFVFDRSNLLMVAIGLLCYFSLGKAMENLWGTLRFNLFYLSGVVLMDIFGMALGGMQFEIGGYLYGFSQYIAYNMSYYLNLSLFLAYATLYPDTHFLLFFFIPVKAWIFALIDLVITFYDVISMTIAGFFPISLFPLVALANYFLFFGKDVINVLPVSWRANLNRLFRIKGGTQKKNAASYTMAGSYRASTATVKAPYTHRCSICGRTDVSHPAMEFRYCSRCNGYFCYCQEHINNHTHVE